MPENGEPRIASEANERAMGRVRAGLDRGLGRALQRGFYGEVGLRAVVQDGTLQTLEIAVVRRERLGKGHASGGGAG